MGFLSAIGSIVGNIIAPGIGGAIGGGLGGLGDSLIGGGSSNKSSEQQVGAIDQATKLQADIYKQNRTDQLPWLGAGTAGVNQLSYLLGITPVDPNAGQTNADGTPKTSTFNPTAGVNTSIGGYGSLSKPFSTADFQVDPGYQFALDQGTKALQNSAAAKGNLFSGATGKALTEYGQGMANQQYQNAYDRYNTNQTNLYNRLAGISGVGQQSAQSLATQGQNYADNVGNLGLQAGKINAQTAQKQTDAWSTGLNGIGSALTSSLSPWQGYNNSGATMKGLDPYTGITWS